jgi:hypothetical protein
MMLIGFLVFGAFGPLPISTPAQATNPSGSLTIGSPQVSGGINTWVAAPVSTNSFSISFSFGELSPANQNAVVVITIPITVNITSPYQILLGMNKPAISDANAVQYTDIGVGIQNLRRIGSSACAGVVQSPFSNNPSTSFTLNAATKRAVFVASLNNIGTSTVVIRGPALSSQGASFDLIFAAVPQFFTPGSFSFTITISLALGTSITC